MTSSSTVALAVDDALSHVPSGCGCMRWSVVSSSVRSGKSKSPPPRKVTVKMAEAWPLPERWTITPAPSGTSEAMATSASASEASQGKCAVASLVRVRVRARGRDQGWGKGRGWGKGWG